MLSIISELDQDTAVYVMRLWRKLNDACGLKGIFNYPNPHFTWLTAESVEEKPICKELDVIAENTYAFPVKSTGLNAFRGESPVLYLSLFKSLALANLHKNIWWKLEPFLSAPNPLYSPEQWVPHITLALRDLTNENLDCAVKSVEKDANEQVLWVNNLLLVEADQIELGETIYRVGLL